MTFTERTLRSREAGDGRKDAGLPDRRWHQKAKDWFKDTFCNIGLTMKRAAIMITVPTMVVATSCSQPAAPDHDADGDADTDADVETDGGPDA
ncbi:TPA: hypothetical protein EYP38_04940, partial [Candidatus Micrarchaeota archaeon]|nr:hypothetical protein [Candidatus Micrarchaeota archaeon]